MRDNGWATTRSYDSTPPPNRWGRVPLKKPRRPERAQERARCRRGFLVLLSAAVSGGCPPGPAARHFAVAAACVRVERGPVLLRWRQLPARRAAWLDRWLPRSGQRSRALLAGRSGPKVRPALVLALLLVPALRQPERLARQPLEQELEQELLRPVRLPPRLVRQLPPLRPGLPRRLALQPALQVLPTQQLLARRRLAQLQPRAQQQRQALQRLVLAPASQLLRRLARLPVRRPLARRQLAQRRPLLPRSALPPRRLLPEQLLPRRLVR